MSTNNAINLSAQGIAYYDGTSTFTAPALTQHGVVVGAAANDVSTLAVGATGTVFIGETGANPTFSNVGTTGTVLIGTTGADPSFSATLSITSLVVSGNSTFNNIDVTGTATINNLDVTGTATINNLDVTGNTTMNNVTVNNIDVTGTATINNLTVTGTTNITTPDGGFVWSDKTASFTAVAGNGYFVTGTTTATLPAAPAEGDSIVIDDDDASLLVTVQAAAGQVIRIGTQVSATAGTVKNTARGDSLTLTFRTTGLSWNARAVQGNWTVT